MLDPTPDIGILFEKFNHKFFNGKLSDVKVEWSQKMTSIAGGCYCTGKYSKRKAHIRLSEPLLKFRNRKDIIEILLVKALDKTEIFGLICFKYFSMR